jgi:predicted small lipoprotein YifL
MRLYRYLPALILALAVLALLSACGGKGGGGY